MPITEITQGTTGRPVLDVTCSNCGADQTVDASTLTLGAGQSPHAIALPPCSCGAQEFLQRTFDVHPVEHEAGHRLAVNALAEHLKATGRIHENHGAAINSAGTPPQVGRLLGAVPFAGKRRAKSVPAPDAVAAAKAALEAAKAAYAKAVGAAA